MDRLLLLSPCEWPSLRKSQQSSLHLTLLDFWHLTLWLCTDWPRCYVGLWSHRRAIYIFFRVAKEFKDFVYCMAKMSILVKSSTKLMILWDYVITMLNFFLLFVNIGVNYLCFEFMGSESFKKPAFHLQFRLFKEYPKCLWLPQHRLHVVCLWDIMLANRCKQCRNKTVLQLDFWKFSWAKKCVQLVN